LDQCCRRDCLALLIPSAVTNPGKITDRTPVDPAAEAISDDIPKSVLGATEGCRIFKAAQLNLLGASQLINSLQNQGSDPLPDFYKSNPSGKVDFQP